MELFRIYTGGVVRKQTAGRHELAELLKDLRTAARMTREQLAELADLSVGPIKRIETEGHVPKAQTLRQLAIGLATYAPGRSDKELAAGYYDRLMQAAGYLPDDALEPLTDSESDWRPGYRQRLRDFFGDDLEIADQALEQLARLGQTERRFVLSLIQGGVGHWLGRPSSSERAVPNLR